MHGWTYDDVVSLPPEVYAVLVDMLSREAEK